MVFGCLWLAARLTLLSMRRTVVRPGGEVEKEELCPCNLFIAMVRRADACGAFGSEAEDIAWGKQRYYTLQTQAIAAERAILLRVNLGRCESDEAVIAKALGLSSSPRSARGLTPRPRWIRL